MTKDYYIIPLTIISFAMNATLVFKVTEMNLAIEYIFSIFISIGVAFMTYRLLLLIDSGLLFFFFSFLIGVGIFLYTAPFNFAVKLFLGIEIAFIIAMQKDCKSIATNEKTIAKTEIRSIKKDLQELVIEDLQHGLSNKEICEKHNLQPYQVSRIKSKI